MPFQFQCPEGHLLEADESQIGEQSQCPMCGQVFAVPSPDGMAPAPEWEAPAPEVNPFPFGSSASPQEDPNAFAFGQGPAASPFDPTGAMSGPTNLHIPCPNGHELEVPPDMVGQDAMCPHCGVQFLLREKDSVEAKRRKQEQLELKDYKAGKNWLMWAVIFGVLVLIGLGIMIAMSAGG